MRVVDFNADEAEWIGDEDDGCYVQVAEQTREAFTAGTGLPLPGWYCTVVIDCDTASFVQDLYTDEGPFETKDEALEFGHCSATEWCLLNGVNLLA